MLSYKFAEYHGPLQPVEEPTPEPKGAEVLVKVDACGVCHSDIHLWEGFFDMGGGKKADISRFRKLPFTLGHEIVGTVAAVGPDAKGVKVGDKRVVYPWIGCGECPACKGGEENLCSAKPHQLGCNVDGGYADHVLVPGPQYLFDYGSVSTELAATYACSGITAYGALNKVKRKAEGRHLLIIGAGGVGFNGLTIAQAMMNTTIIVADIDDKKLEAAKAAGAHHVVNPKDDTARKQIMGLTGGGVPAAVDFVGSDKTVGFGVSALGMNGTLVVVGLFGGSLNLSVPLLPLKALTLQGSITGTLAEMGDLMALVRAGKVKPLPVATRPLSAAAETLADLQAGKIVGRVVLKP